MLKEVAFKTKYSSSGQKSDCRIERIYDEKILVLISVVHAYK